VSPVTTPAPVSAPANPVRARLPFLLLGAAGFLVLLVITAITESNTLGSIVAVYGIVGGVLLGRLLAKAERQARPSDET
jgi:membrane associated rhomboid family serine protease